MCLKNDAPWWRTEAEDWAKSEFAETREGERVGWGPQLEGRGLGRILERESQLDHNKTFIKVICFALGHLHSYELERNWFLWFIEIWTF